MHITDDASRYSHVYCLTTKDKAFETFKQFSASIKQQRNWDTNAINLYSTEPDCKIRGVRMDGDSVFNSKEFTDWMKDRGIKIQVTSRDCPQDNGRAERYGRSLVEMARCLLAHSGLPKGFWKNAIECACYIKNRLPHKSISSTPYTLWFGEKPDLSGLRAFECLAS